MPVIPERVAALDVARSAGTLDQDLGSVIYHIVDRSYYSVEENVGAERLLLQFELRYSSS